MTNNPAKTYEVAVIERALAYYKVKSEDPRAAAENWQDGEFYHSDDEALESEGPCIVREQQPDGTWRKVPKSEWEDSPTTGAVIPAAAHSDDHVIKSALLTKLQAVAELRRKWRSQDEAETIDSIEYMDGLDALDLDAAIAEAKAAGIVPVPTAPRLLDELQAVLPYAEAERASLCEAWRRDRDRAVNVELHACDLALSAAAAAIAEAKADGITPAPATAADEHPSRFEIEHDPKENPDRVYVLVDGLFDIKIVRTAEGIVIDAYSKDGLDIVGTMTVREEDVAEPDAAEEACQAAIPTEAHSDDHVLKVEFDALPWFERATDQAILALGRCGWGGDYPADEVAIALAETVPDLARLFAYLEVIANDATKKDCRGFECHVDDVRALEWLKSRRPAIWVELTGNTLQTNAPGAAAAEEA